jgi:hypothetical protein
VIGNRGESVALFEELANCPVAIKRFRNRQGGISERPNS